LVEEKGERRLQGIKAKPPDDLSLRIPQTITADMPSQPLQEIKAKPPPDAKAEVKKPPPS
jgi:hypothetical protein